MDHHIDIGLTRVAYIDLIHLPSLTCYPPPLLFPTGIQTKTGFPKTFRSALPAVLKSEGMWGLYKGRQGR